MSFEILWPYDCVDLRVTFEFDSGVPSRLLCEVLQLLEQAFFETARDDLEAIFPILAKDRDIDIWTLRGLLNASKGNALLITNARSGCVVIEGALAGLCMWVVLNTVGESFKEAWLKTEAHKKIVETLNADLVEKTRKIVRLAKSAIKQSPALSMLANEQRLTLVEDAYDAQKIVATVDIRGANIVKVYSDWTDDAQQ